MSSSGTSGWLATSSFQFALPGLDTGAVTNAKGLRRVVGSDVEGITAMVDVVLDVVDAWSNQLPFAVRLIGRKKAHFARNVAGRGKQKKLLAQALLHFDVEALVRFLEDNRVLAGFGSQFVPV